MTGLELGAIASLVAFVGVFIKGALAFADRLAKVGEKAKADTDAAHAKAGAIGTELGMFRLHVAERYVSKEDMQTALEPVMDGVNKVQHSIDNVTSRLDRVIDQRGQPASRRPGSN